VLSVLLCRGTELHDESFSVFLQVLISQTLQPTFIDELTSQPGITLYFTVHLSARYHVIRSLYISQPGITVYFTVHLSARCHVIL